MINEQLEKLNVPEGIELEEPTGEVNKEEVFEKLNQLVEEPVSEVPTEQPQEPETQLGDGLPSLEELDLPEDLNLETQVNFDTPEAKKLDEDLRKVLGFGLKDIADGANSLKQVQAYFQQIQAKEYERQARGSLEKDWGLAGADFDKRIERVYERFNKYPKDMQDKLDNVEGIKLIWAKIQQEEAISGNKVPQFQRSSGMTTGKTKPLFSKRELDAMSEAEYAANADKIMRAYQLGLVAD